MYTGKGLANQMPSAARKAHLSGTNLRAKQKEISTARKPYTAVPKAMAMR
jgi:hypothetical protein